MGKMRNIQNTNNIKNKKNAISLIVLVITIIVLAILSAAVIISISNTNIMTKARTSSFKNDMASLKEAYSMWCAKKTAETNSLPGDSINVTYASDEETFIEIFGKDVAKEYLGSLEIKNGRLVFNTEDEERIEILTEFNMLPFPVTGVSLDKTNISVVQGNSELLIATIEPSVANNKKLIWTSSNTDVATIDQNGNVTAIASGTATITVRTIDGNFSANCTVTSTNCFAKGTKITMANDVVKNIEDIKLGDNVLTFNHQKGEYEPQEVYYIHRGNTLASTFTLYFSNGNNLTIVGEHDLFEEESLKYVTISKENIESLVGKHFYSTNDKMYVELASIICEEKNVEYYSIYTKNNGNCIANGMLSAPDDGDFVLSIYSFNHDLTIDHTALNLDIEKYGIWEYDSTILYTMEEYDFMNLRYVNIMIGKGIVTWEQLFNIREEYLVNK